MKKKQAFLGFFLSALMIATVGCSGEQSQSKETLGKDQLPLPNFVLTSAPIVQSTYVLAANHPDVLQNVPCYCGCGEEEGHQSNLDCFVNQMGPDHKVLKWDQHGSA